MDWFSQYASPVWQLPSQQLLYGLSTESVVGQFVIYLNDRTGLATVLRLRTAKNTQLADQAAVCYVELRTLVQ